MEDILLKKYNAARRNLLITVAFTFVNCLLIVSKSSVSFLFSTTTPQLLFVLAPFLKQEYMIGAYVIAVVFIAILVLCYFSSKDTNRYGWLIAATVLVVLDALFTLYLIVKGNSEELRSLYINIVFDLVIVSLVIQGVFAGIKFNKHMLEKSNEFFAQQTGTNPSFTENPNQYTTQYAQPISNATQIQAEEQTDIEETDNEQ